MTHGNVEPPDHSSHTPHRYHIEVGDEAFEFRPVEMFDPVPTGRQIVHAAGIRSADEFAPVAILPDGNLQELLLEEAYDLQALGIKRVLVFETDRLLRFRIDDVDAVWGAPSILGRVLKAVARVDPTAYDVYFEVPTGQNRLVQDEERFDLSAPHIELFRTAKRPTSWELKVNRVLHNWPRSAITGAEIKQLAGSPANFLVNQKTDGPGEDPEIGDQESVDLSKPGIEHFTTRAPSTSFGR